MDYTSSIDPLPLTLSLGLSMFCTVAHVHAATQCRQKISVLLFETVTNAVKHKNLFILSKTRVPARSKLFNNCAVTLYEINSVEYFNQNLALKELYACTF